MSDEDITLTAGDAEATVQPGNGGRVGGLRVGGLELLRQGERFGCFPMVPWCGRIRDGRFLDGATVRQMPLNAPPHAIHGTARDGAWKVARVTADEAVLTYDLVEPWPHPGRITQIVRLTEDSLTLSMGVETHGSSFPAQIGWHPGSTARWAVRTSRSPSSPPGRRSAARTTCRPATVSSRGPAPGTTASGCPGAWTSPSPGRGGWPCG